MRMNITKINVRETVIPIQKGTLRILDFEDEKTVEVELSVHPTVLSFFNSQDYRKERFTLQSEDEETKIVGEFEIHIGNAGILLVGNPKEVQGIDHLTAIPYEMIPLQKASSNVGVPLVEELSINQNIIFVHFLEALLKNEIHDRQNYQLIRSLQDKLINEKKLDELDQYIKDEISYLIEEIIEVKE